MPIVIDKADQEAVILKILAQLAQKNHKSIKQIKRLLFIKKNRAITKQFCNILDDMFPGHPYQCVNCCPDCGALELH